MGTKVDTYFEKRREQDVEQLAELLRIPSVSGASEHRQDVKRTADWLAQKLREAGVPRVDLMSTPGYPIVFGEWLVDKGLPTALIYAHYDVQPPDPIDEWVTPPFEPDIRDGRIFARGATDDKGLLFTCLKAIEAFYRLNSQPPINIKLIFEGEEEIGSPNLPGFMENHRELLSADIALKAQGGMWDYRTPSLTTRTRGLVALQIDVRGPNHDLHSGMYGGGIQNPIHALTSILSSMHDTQGRVTVEGFYRNVHGIAAGEREAIEAIPIDETEYKRELEVADLFGEAGYATWERLWIRPTLEINGIWGGFQGEGPKTVLPSLAHAKITCRLVPNQDAEEIATLIEDHVGKFSPPGVVVSVQRFPGSAKPYVMPMDHPALASARDVLRKVYGRAPLVTPVGGTLPFAGLVTEILGIYLVYFGFGGRGNNVHGPNESFPLEAFDKGVRVYYAFMEELSKIPKDSLTGLEIPIRSK